jgi:hypothetical protein
MFLKMLGPEPLELTMPWLRGGPYTAEPGAVFEVDGRDGEALLQGNGCLFQPVDTPEKGLMPAPLASGLAAKEGEAGRVSMPSPASPVEEKPRRRKKAAPEATGKGE